MPDFEQKDLRPVKSITVHFASQEDVQAFAALVGQPIGPKTKSLWYPEAEVGRYAHLRYAAEPAE